MLRPIAQNRHTDEKSVSRVFELLGSVSDREPVLGFPNFLCQ
ncbi:MAG: hypothetical protein Q8J66_05510 [Methylotenera sp.]|nr:hypothetical protein [Methylotenera sp.]